MGTLYTEETTVEQERSADFLQECIMLRDNVFFITVLLRKN